MYKLLYFKNKLGSSYFLMKALLLMKHLFILFKMLEVKFTVDAMEIFHLKCLVTKRSILFRLDLKMLILVVLNILTRYHRKF